MDEVHRHIEDRRLRFVLCGSSARKLKTAGTNRLAGRAVAVLFHGEVINVSAISRDAGAARTTVADYLEVRSGRKLFDADLRGLRAIADLPHVVRRIVVCRGDRRQKTADGIDVLPVAAFLAHLEGQSVFP